MTGLKNMWMIACCIPIILTAQVSKVTLSGRVSDATKTPLPFVNIALKTEKDSALVAGTITDEAGQFRLADVPSESYVLVISYVGYETKLQPVLVGKLSAFLDLGMLELQEAAQTLDEVVVTAQQDEVAGKMDKKTFNIEENISQGGGSVLQSMRNLPGITVDQEGKVQLRGSDKVTILIDGKQTALTGFGNQTGLDNIPASAIEKIEIINNPSAKYDANGNAGIINIIYKTNKQEGFNGKVGITAGIGSWWEKRENLPNIRPQYQQTHKLNPSLSLNHRKEKLNLFFQGDLLSQKLVNKNDFIVRSYNDGDIIRQQYQENRTQLAITAKTGVDWYINANNTLTFSALYGREAHIDRGDLPYYNNDFSERRRLWQFYEDEVNYTGSGAAVFQHKFQQPGHSLNVSFSYTFLQEDEQYWMTNTMPTFIGRDTFKLIADQHVSDLNIDYVKPLRSGRMELGTKFRRRYIPTDMRFSPGLNSPLDVNADGWANYNEIIPAVYGNYVFESKHFEIEAGLRVEYVTVDYEVTPNHNTYQSDGYDYFQPFPNLRIAYLFNESNKLSIFYNRRVDRPDEQDIRIFPKYDDPEILRIGNPALRPQFTQTVELGYKTSWENGYFYSAFYARKTDNILTRILTLPPESRIINSIAQNAGDGSNTGIELIFNQKVSTAFSFNVNLNGYQNIIEAFSIENTYPVSISYTSNRIRNYSGNAKFNGILHLKNQTDIQLTGIYLAPDIIPQGEIAARYSIDFGLKKAIQKGKGELFFNVSDVFNTMRIRKLITSNGFTLSSTDYYETQVARLGYNYKF